MRTLNFSILFVYLNFNKFPSFDFRVHWNARNSEKRTRKFRLPSILERGISHGHLQCGRCSDSNGKLLPLTYRFATSNWGWNCTAREVNEVVEVICYSCQSSKASIIFKMSSDQIVRVETCAPLVCSVVSNIVSHCGRHQSFEAFWKWVSV